ncbi:MAG TPA: hypothetical protein DCO79_15455, partial [Spirochaeta sp.]|nr:hypothetical protein [Spirochaeta sp.]
MKIINLLLKRPVGVIMLWAGIILGGIWAGLTMEADFLPAFSVPKLTVIAPWQGVPASQIRELVTIPLEDSLSSLGGLKEINSISRDGIAVIELEFPWGTDRTEAGIRTREVIDLAWQRLPSDASKPQVLAADPGDVPIITLAVYPKNGDLMIARRLAARELRARLQRIEGVGSVQVSGGLVEEVLIRADFEAAAGIGYTLPVIAQALEASNIDSPSGTITEGRTEYIVKTRARAQNITELGDIYLPQLSEDQGSSNVRLSDIADISIEARDPVSFYYSASGQNDSLEGVRIVIRRRDGFSPTKMAANILEEMPEIKRSFGESLSIEIVQDRSQALNKAMRNLVVSLLSGAFFAFIIILVFMKRLSRALILLVSLPASLLSAVLLLFLFGRSLNLMSLGGLALGVGMVVDNSIVITERLSRRVNARDSLQQRQINISETVVSLVPSLAGSTLTTVIVFLPLIFISGLPGALFGGLGLSVIFALGSSLAAALSLIPVLYMVLNPEASRADRGRGFKQLRRLVRISLRRPVPVILAVVVLIAAGFLPFSKIHTAVVSPVNEGLIRARVMTAPGTSAKAVSQLARELTAETASRTSASQVTAHVGGEPDDPYFLASAEQSAETIMLSIKYPLEYGYKRIEAELSALLELPGSSFVIEPPENILEELIGGRDSNDWLLSGDNPEALRRSMEAIILEPELDAAGVVMLPADTKRTVRITPDREALASYGIGVDSIAGQLGSAVYGRVPTRL